MRVAILGRDTSLKRQTESELSRAGIAITDSAPDCVICLEPERVQEALATPGISRLVLRSHAYAYGSSAKTPGPLTEDRISLLPLHAPEQRWLRAEQQALTFPNTAIVRLTNILDTEEGDLLVKQISKRLGVSLAGFDPCVQFISVRDAARALAAAVSSATGLFNAAGPGVIRLKKVFRAAGATRISVPGGVKMHPLQYNWTVSSQKAARELGYTPEQSTIEALADFLRNKPRARPDLLAKSYDDYGLDTDYIRAWGWWFAFLRRVYWRIEHEGLERIPATDGAMFDANRRGFLPPQSCVHTPLLLPH